MCFVHALSERPRLERDLLLSILHQLLAAVQHVHAARWVHRDIKPANFLYFADGTVKLADFGCAKKWSPIPDWKCVTSHSLCTP